METLIQKGKGNYRKDKLTRGKKERIERKSVFSGFIVMKARNKINICLEEMIQSFARSFEKTSWSSSPLDFIKFDSWIGLKGFTSLLPSNGSIPLT